jgi:hypothetical protein
MISCTCKYASCAYVARFDVLALIASASAVGSCQVAGGSTVSSRVLLLVVLALLAKIREGH